MGDNWSPDEALMRQAHLLGEEGGPAGPLFVGAPYPTRAPPSLTELDEVTKDKLVMMEGRYTNQHGGRPTRLRLRAVMR